MKKYQYITVEVNSQQELENALVKYGLQGLRVVQVQLVGGKMLAILEKIEE